MVTVIKDYSYHDSCFDLGFECHAILYYLCHGKFNCSYSNMEVKPV